MCPFDIRMKACPLPDRLLCWVNAMLNKYCTKCGKLMIYNGRNLCDECLSKVNEIRKDNDRIYNRRIRNKKSDQFYHSKEWKTLSKIVLAKADYKCAICGGLAVEVHHIKEINVDWNERFNLNNLMPLCTSCHNKQR